MSDETRKIVNLVGTSAQFSSGGGRKGLAGHDTDLGSWKCQLDASGNFAVYARRDAAQTFTGLQTFNAGVTLSAGDLNASAGAIQTAGVTRISSGGAGTLTTLSTTGLATLQSLKVPAWAGAWVRPVVVGTDGIVSSDESGATMHRLAGYITVRCPMRLTGERYEFWDPTAGYALLDCANVQLRDLTASQMVATDASKKLVTLDAAESRALIGAQAELGYTPANRAGDTFSGQVVVTDPTNVVAQPNLLVSVGGGSVAGEVGFHSDGASVGKKNWGAGVSRDFSCFRIMSYTDDWSGRTECIRVGTDYLDLSNAYANALAVGYKIGGLKVVGSRKSGWGAPTGTATRTTFATSTVTLQQLAERVKALIDDLTAHGLIGA